MKKLLFIVIIFSSAFTSCKKDFDELNPNDPPITAFWYTADDAVKGVNAIYSVFHRGYAGFSRAMYFHGMLKSDEGYGSGGDGGLNTLMSFAMTDATLDLQLIHGITCTSVSIVQTRLSLTCQILKWMKL
jgi:hypothetical protein